LKVQKKKAQKVPNQLIGGILAIQNNLSLTHCFSLIFFFYSIGWQMNKLNE